MVKKNPLRKAISKSLRFSIFARDRFTCRYCGKQSDEVRLVIDHMVPVSKGGINHESNLITSCEECNQGKSDKVIETFVPNDQDRLRLIQENLEQLHAAKAAVQIVFQERELRQELCNFFCECRGTEEMKIETLNLLYSFCRNHGFEIVCDWITIAATRLPVYSTDVKFAKYISGIRRQWLEKNREDSES